jgi:hypothetical protein
VNSDGTDNTDYSGFIPGWAADPSSGYSIAPAIGLPSMSGQPMPADVQDMNQMQPYSPAGNTMPWYQSAMLYGITKAVDNLGRTTVAGNTDPGSFAGYNGRTYTQIPQGQGGGAMRPASTTVTGKVTGNPMILLALAGVVAFVLLKK